MINFISDTWVAHVIIFIGWKLESIKCVYNISRAYTYNISSNDDDRGEASKGKERERGKKINKKNGIKEEKLCHSHSLQTYSN